MLEIFIQEKLERLVPSGTSSRRQKKNNTPNKCPTKAVARNGLSGTEAGGCKWGDSRNYTFDKH